MKCRHNSFLSKIEVDILLINLLSIVLISVVALSLVTIPFNIIRAILAFPFVTFFPGYLLSKILFSKEEVNIIERIALSFGISMMIVSVIGLILAYSPLKITLYSSILSIYSFILITSVIGQFRPGYSRKGKIKLHLSSKQINALLTAILITMLGIFVRFYPALDYSTFGGNWMPGNHLYPIYYTLQTGELLERGAIETPTLFSSTIYNVLHNKANIAFQPFYFLIAGITDLNEFLWLNKFFPWYGAILFPLSALLVANRISRIEREEIPLRYSLFIYFVATFASYKLLVDSRFMLDNAVISYSFILFTIYFLLGDKSFKNQLLGMPFGIFCFLYYYTAGIVLLIMLASVLVFQITKKEEIVSANYIIFYGISFIAYYMYLAHVVFRSYVMTLREALLLPGAMPAQAIWGRELTRIESIPHLSAHLNLALLGAFLIAFIYWWLRKKIEHSHYINLSIYLCFGLILISLLFFSWRGLKGVARISSYILIPFLLIFPLLLTKNRKWIFIAALCIVITSLVAYIPGTVIHLGYLTNSEKNAVVWYTIHGEKEKIVFTDFRIGTAPIMLDFFTFTGITGHESRLNEYLIGVYYGTNSFSAYKVLTKYKASSILLSKEMMNHGILGSQEAYKPLPQQALVKYSNSICFHKIYDNSKAWYYSRCECPSCNGL